MQKLIEANPPLSLPVEKVSDLLDAYHWQDDARRKHMHYLLRMCLHAIAEFRTDMAEAVALISKLEIEACVDRARKRAQVCPPCDNFMPLRHAMVLT